VNISCTEFYPNQTEQYKMWANIHLCPSTKYDTPCSHFDRSHKAWWH